MNRQRLPISIEGRLSQYSAAISGRDLSGKLLHPANATIMVLLRTRLHLFCLVCICALYAPGAWAMPRTLSDSELTDVSGQGLASVDNTTLNGLNFSTITLNSVVTLNANLSNVVLGQYVALTNNGSGADINIPLVQFGTSAGTTAQQTVQITNPYVEFVYNNAAGAGNSQVVGMRLGFGGISGNVGLLMNTVSGALQISDGAVGVLSSDSYRSTSACAGSTCMPLSQIGGVVAGNASGPSRDFWISMLSQAVQFPAQSGLAQPAQAQAGMWLNWTDRLSAQNTAGTVQANILAALHR